MSWILAKCWPVGQWAPGDPVEVIGWPIEITNAIAMTGLPAIKPPVTIAQAELFHLRPWQVQMNLNVAFATYTHTQTITFVRWQDSNHPAMPLPPSSSGLLIEQGDEELGVIPGEPDYYVYRPSWTSSGAEPIGVDGDFINWNLFFSTEHLWIDQSSDIAFFNLCVSGLITCRLGEPGAPEEVEFYFREQPITDYTPPIYPGPDGLIDIYGGQLVIPTYKVNPLMVDYVFSLDTFAPFKYFKYARADNSLPTYHEDTGAQLHPPQGPDGR